MTTAATIVVMVFGGALLSFGLAVLVGLAWMAHTPCEGCRRVGLYSNCLSCERELCLSCFERPACAHSLDGRHS